MAENLFCEELNCGQAAHVFGFVGAMKRKVCEEHALTLIRKQVTVYDIAAFTFMQSSQDHFLYEQRRGSMQRGLGNLTSLETACDRDWEGEQKRLQENCEAVHEIVQRSFQEMWVKAQQRYEEMKQELAELRNGFEQLVLDLDFQLSPEYSALYEGVPTDHLFHVTVGTVAYLYQR